MTASAVQSYVGSLTVPASTGSQSITGVGFQPKLIWFFMNQATADGTYADSGLAFGTAVSSSSRHYGYGRSKDALAGGSGSYAQISNATHCIGICTAVAEPGPPVQQCEADLTSMDADGFTLNWTTANGTRFIVNYLALGGADFTNTFLGDDTFKTTTGNKSYTGVGFVPTLLLTQSPSNSASAPPRLDSQPPQVGLGFALSATQRAGAFTSNQNWPATIADHGYQRTTRNLAVLTDAAVGYENDLVTMDSDGFTLNQVTTGGLAAHFLYDAIKGGQYAIGSLSQPGATGNVSTTGLGFQPAALILLSYNLTAQTTIQAHGRLSLGIGTSATQRGCCWFGGTNGVATSVEKSDLDRTKIIKLITEGSVSSTTNAAADLVSLDPDGWTLNWTTADATVRQVLYLAIGPNQQTSAPSSDITDGNWLNASASNVNLYQSIDEPGPIGIDDTDYIQSGANPQSDLVEVGLGAITTPLVSAGLYLDYRTRLDATLVGGAMSLVTEVRQASGALSTPVTDTIAPASTTETTNTVTWSAAQIASILDGSTLTLRATATQATSPLPVFVGASVIQATASNGADIPSVTPAAGSVGDLLLLVVQRNDTQAAPTVTNWTNIANLTGTQTGQSVAVFYKYATGTAGATDATGAITFGSSTLIRAGFVLRYSGSLGSGEPTGGINSRLMVASTATTVGSTNITSLVDNTLGLFLPIAIGLRTSSGVTAITNWAGNVITLVTTTTGVDATFGYSHKAFATAGSYLTPAITWTANTTTGAGAGLLLAIKPVVNNSKVRITWAQLRVPTPLRLPFTRMQYLSHLGQPN